MSQGTEGMILENRAENDPLGLWLSSLVLLADPEVCRSTERSDARLLRVSIETVSNGSWRTRRDVTERRKEVFGVNSEVYHYKRSSDHQFP